MKEDHGALVFVRVLGVSGYIVWNMVVVPCMSVYTVCCLTGLGYSDEKHYHDIIFISVDIDNYLSFLKPI